MLSSVLYVTESLVHIRIRLTDKLEVGHRMLLRTILEPIKGMIECGSITEKNLRRSHKETSNLSGTYLTRESHG